MEISVACSNAAFYPKLKEIRYCGIDMPFASYTQRETILADAYTDTVLDGYHLLCEAGLRLCQTHLSYLPTHLPPFGDGSYQAYEDYMLPIYRKEIELTGRMNCGVAVMHPYYEADREKSREGNIALISKLLPVLEENHVILSLENIFGNRYSDIYLSNAEDMLFYTDYFQSPYVGVCLDTGHAIIRKEDPIEMLKKIGEKLTAVHLHTTVPTIDLHAIPYCTGYGERIGWKELAQELEKLPYQGTFNMEIRPPSKFTDQAAKTYYQLAYDVAKGILEQE